MDPKKESTKGLKGPAASLKVGVENEWGRLDAGGSRGGGARGGGFGGADGDFFAMNVIPGTPMDEGSGFGLFPGRGGGDGQAGGGRLAPSPIVVGAPGGRSRSGSDASASVGAVGTGGWWDRISWSSSRPGSSSTQQHG